MLWKGEQLLILNGYETIGKGLFLFVHFYIENGSFVKITLHNRNENETKAKVKKKYEMIINKGTLIRFMFTECVALFSLFNNISKCCQYAQLAYYLILLLFSSTFFSYCFNIFTRGSNSRRV